MENELVRVLDTWLAPGDRTPVHTHEWPASLYVLGWSDFVRYDPDGNVGNAELRVIAVEVKGADPGQPQPVRTE